MGARTKYGVRFGTPDFTTKGALYTDGSTAVVLSKKSGRYVVNDVSDDAFKICADNAAAITGYVEQDLTSSTTSKKTVVSVATNVDQFVCELPYALAGAAGTLTDATLADAKGRQIDLYVASNIQYADVASDQAVFECVGGSVENNTLYVKVIAATMLNQA